MRPQTPDKGIAACRLRVQQIEAFLHPPSGRGMAQRMDLHGSHPRNTGPDHQSARRPGVGVATGARQVRDGVTGSALSEELRPTVALGLDSTEAGIQMETVIPHITLPEVCKETRCQ
jgi:hypothetical protein